ncbi:MAG: holo-ACP synthase [Anaerolineales bacterium]|nr:holo-ACP synthase [Anaerolineales bacterium]
MNISSGIDLIEIERIEKALNRHGERFLKRIFSKTELEKLVKFKERRVNPRLIAAEVAARFAAKEACSKALGTGIGPVSWKEMEVINEPSGKPTLRLSGKAAQIADAQGFTSWTVSLTHTKDTAAAVVVCIGAG